MIVCPVLNEMTNKDNEDNIQDYNSNDNNEDSDLPLNKKNQLKERSLQKTKKCDF